MIRKGDLYQGQLNNEPVLIQIERTYDKPDIDPNCPESVAIIGMVEGLIMSGTGIGKMLRFQRRSFRHRFSKVEVTNGH